MGRLMSRSNSTATDGSRIYSGNHKKRNRERKSNLIRNMTFLGIIPARYASTRFPGKPLALLGGRTVIERVYRQAEKALQQVVVATDDERILQAVEAFGGKAVMTSPTHRSGTDRCREALSKCGMPADVVINIQGDEPFIQPAQLETLKACFEDTSTDIATLVQPFQPEDGFAALNNPNSPKVVVNSRMEALLFSRSVIPYLRGVEEGDEWLRRHTFYKHIGIYAYRAQVLDAITRLEQSELEKMESLEQLRWLENGYKIKVGITQHATIGIDTPEDLQRAEEFLKTLSATQEETNE